MVTTENGERVIRAVRVPDSDDDEQDGGNRPGSFETLFMALGGGIPPLPEQGED